MPECVWSAHQKAYQALHQVVTLADKHAPGNGQVPVKPGVPEAASIWLHVDHHKAGLHSVRDGLQLQARAARAMTCIQCLIECKAYWHRMTCQRAIDGPSYEPTCMGNQRILSTLDTFKVSCAAAHGTPRHKSQRSAQVHAAHEVGSFLSTSSAHR